jgi:hypothetical protein
MIRVLIIISGSTIAIDRDGVGLVRMLEELTKGKFSKFVEIKGKMRPFFRRRIGSPG